MTPPTVNAYYDPQMNDINFPAGVLQPPAFDPKSDAAPNYGDTAAPSAMNSPTASTTKAASSTLRATCAFGGPRTTRKNS
jgi:hypothetical protein